MKEAKFAAKGLTSGFHDQVYEGTITREGRRLRITWPCGSDVVMTKSTIEKTLAAIKIKGGIAAIYNAEDGNGPAYIATLADKRIVLCDDIYDLGGLRPSLPWADLASFKKAFKAVTS